MCFGMARLGFGPLPVVMALIFFIQCFIVYTIAVVKQDVDAIFPYISSTADKRPESCIFAIGTNISSVLLFLLVLIRYRQLRGVAERLGDEELAKYSWLARCFGNVSAVGMFIVANVQETAIIPVHMYAALATFGGFTVYMMIQCFLTYKVTPSITQITVFYYRLIFTILSTIFFLTAFFFGVAASNEYHQTYPDLPTPRPWSRRFYQPGYELHQISAMSEWACAISQIFFIVSFGPEFEEITIEYYFRSIYIDRDFRAQEAYNIDRARNAI